ncbi:hypothetical protein JCM19047_2893 [Bacillus sp. JCM 19047]|nr:hypothetical protein JCM19047_2893 [Bacillus sp. JCM 19047]
MTVIALYMSAWIEMNLSGNQKKLVGIALYMSAWIEMSNIHSRSSSEVSHSI